jgi:hypothetical protein
LPADKPDALQERMLAGLAELPQSATELHGEMKRRLLAASNARELADAPHDILNWLKRKEAPEHGLGAHAIVGGAKNFRRDPAQAHFTRADGAWFDFALTVRERSGQPLELLAYNFEIRFPGDAVPQFLRFDLNSPKHSNQDAGHRSHLHPGNDDLLLPYPALTPIEILDLFVHGLQRRTPEAPRK